MAGQIFAFFILFLIIVGLIFSTKRNKLKSALQKQGSYSPENLEHLVKIMEDSKTYNKAVVDGLTNSPELLDEVIKKVVQPPTEKQFAEQFKDLLSKNDVERILSLYGKYIANRNDMPNIHELFALTMLDYGSMKRAQYGIHKSFQQRKLRFETIPTSSNAYSLGLTGYNAAMIFEPSGGETFENSLQFAQESLRYLAIAQQMVTEKKDSDASDLEEWSCGGYFYLPVYYTGELAMLDIFKSLPKRLGLEMPNFSADYCALERFSLASVFIEKLMKSASQHANRLESNAELLKLHNRMQGIHATYFKHTSERMRTIAERTGDGSDHNMLQLNGEYIIQMTNVVVSG